MEEGESLLHSSVFEVKAQFEISAARSVFSSARILKFHSPPVKKLYPLSQSTSRAQGNAGSCLEQFDFSKSG